jgi:hypothetical protein
MEKVDAKMVVEKIGVRDFISGIGGHFWLDNGCERAK